ncbi:MAG: LytTR family transcriptional regulator DNA-binding domain-containing protein, partial [Muribaculaceae bacterium]|nr:LytTR family transcriptional regulator DNA-binding domain-containing protein [Muribaculaceae bacterium]
EAMENYVKIFRRNNPMLVTQVTMKELTSSLPLDRFARIHRSYIVSLSDVETYKLREITLRGVDKVFPLGRTYLSLFREALTLHASLKS